MTYTGLTDVQKKIVFVYVVYFDTAFYLVVKKLTFSVVQGERFDMSNDSIFKSE